MFPIDIITSLIETILGEVGKDIVAKGRDRKRHFARDLFTVYDAAKDYRSSCNRIVDVLERERRIEPERRMTWSAAYEAQQASDRMVELVRTMVGTFQPELLANVKAGRSSDPAASRRFKVLGVFNPNLAALLERAMTIDMGIAYIAGAMAQQKFDPDTQDILLLDPASSDIQAVIDTIHDFRDGQGRASFLGGDKYDLAKRDIARFFRRVKFTDDADYATFIELLRRSMSTIDEFTEAMATFIRTNYQIDELL